MPVGRRLPVGAREFASVARDGRDGRDLLSLATSSVVDDELGSSGGRTQQSGPTQQPPPASPREGPVVVLHQLLSAYYERSMVSMASW
jgi:hypothetical protein